MNRTRLLAVAARQLLEVGFDHVTVNSITREAGMSRGTLYAYFGDVHGVYASLWAEHGLAWLRDVVVGVDHGDDRDLDDVMASILILARRVPALDEVVRPDLHAVWTDVAAGPAPRRVRAVWLLAGLLAHRLLRHSAPDLSGTEIVAPLIAALPDDVEERLGLPTWVQPTETPRVDTPRIEHGDDIASRLADADMQVIASAGLAAATMMRVCRVARVSTGAAAPRFRSLDDLHHSTFELALRDVADTNATQVDRFVAGRSIPDAYTLFVAAALEPQRQLWRRYRQELLVAAAHDPSTAASMRHSFEVTNAHLEDALAVLALRSDQISLVVRFNLVYAVGLAAVLELFPPLDVQEHRLVLHWLFRTGLDTD